MSSMMKQRFQAVFRIRIRIRMDPYPYQETIDMDPGSVKN